MLQSLVQSVCAGGCIYSPLVEVSIVLVWRVHHDSVGRDVLYNILIEFGVPHETGKANKNMSEWNV